MYTVVSKSKPEHRFFVVLAVLVSYIFLPCYLINNFYFSTNNIVSRSVVVKNETKFISDSKSTIEKNSSETKKTETKKTDTFQYYLPSSSDWLKAGKECDTDKVNPHYYHLIYPVHVNNALKQAVLAGYAPVLLELGIYEGSSLCLWKKLYPWLRIVGIDISFQYVTKKRRREFENDSNIDIYEFDLSSPEGVQQVVNTLNDLKLKPVIIGDDASHAPAHQRIAVQGLFSTLVPGGIFIIEDIETSYWGEEKSMYGYTIGKSIINDMKDLIDLPQREFAPSSELKPGTDFMGGALKAEQVGGITSEYNCVIIRKRLIDEQKFINRTYRFRHNLRISKN